MTHTITYSLHNGQRDSSDYYRAVAALADGWFASVTQDVEEIIAKFRVYRRVQHHPDRSEAEYAFELLALGVMLRRYTAEKISYPLWATWLLKLLVNIQDRYPQFESSCKRWRGQLGGVARRAKVDTNTDEVDLLIEWLQANDETTKAGRFAQWRPHFREIGFEATRHVMARCGAIASDFVSVSESVLGKFTQQVPTFLIETAPKYQQRYDAELVSRTRVEYHLGMLGTEVLNRAYRQRFLATRQKVVIVPPCMRAQPEEKCKAIPTPLGAKCQACTLTCRIHQITQLGLKHGFEVYIIPDELRVFGSGTGKGPMGVVGVSCALTNWGGGWEADEAQLPAQGVLLDYVGCSYHWDDQGFPTDTNLKKLQEIVGG